MKLEAGRLRLAASDVANFLACGHLTRLDMLLARGQLRPPRACDAGFQDLVARPRRPRPLGIQGGSKIMAGRFPQPQDCRNDEHRVWPGET